jgi:murein DD-endopeptidase MepM/ murein hydrolase activator NlpD
LDAGPNLRRRMRPRLLLLLAGLAVPLLALAGSPLLEAGAQAPGARSAQIQKKIQTTRGKIGRKKGTERVLSTEISAYTRKINRLQGDITQLYGKQVRLQADFERKRQELTRIQEQLRIERARLARLRSRLAEARDALATRLVELYKADNPDIVTVILNSNGFADLLERTDFMSRVSEQDQRIIKIVRTAKADAIATAKRLDALEARQQVVVRIIYARRNQVAQVRKQLIDKRVGYRFTQNNKQRALQKTVADRRNLEEDLKGMEAANARIQAQLRAAANPSAGSGNVAGPIRHGSGNLIWPVNGSVSSGFGMRWGRLHAGIDIPEPIGTPIRAADGGRVAIAGSVSGYGNYTCIQHTGSMSTCYGHQNTIGVSVGQSVRQGQIIGQTGNTGHSTGPHLHFEVRINGSPVDPMGYL